jgi:hypothetical protein
LTSTQKAFFDEKRPRQNPEGMIVAGSPLARQPGEMDATMLHAIEEILDKRAKKKQFHVPESPMRKAAIS